MISENIGKQEFMARVIERDIKNIGKAQLLIATKNTRLEGKKLKVVKRRGATIGTKTGNLLRSLENPDYIIQMSGERMLVAATVVKQLRFFDMKRFGDWKIYNRQVWGILYNNSRKEIRFGYGQELQDVIGKALDNMFNNS